MSKIRAMAAALVSEHGEELAIGVSHGVPMEAEPDLGFMENEAKTEAVERLLASNAVKPLAVTLRHNVDTIRKMLEADGWRFLCNEIVIELDLPDTSGDAA